MERCVSTRSSQSQRGLVSLQLGKLLSNHVKFLQSQGNQCTIRLSLYNQVKLVFDKS